MKIINKVFHEDTIGFSVIAMLILSAVYIYTESPVVQKIGLYFGLIIIILFIGFSIKSIFEALIFIYRKFR